MTRFNDVSIEAALDAEHVDYCVAVALDFVSGMVRAHLGGGTITINGNDYLGVGVAGSGGFGSLSALIERPDARNYSEIKVSLSGVNPAMVGKVPTRSDYRGRYASIYFFPLDPVTLKPVNPSEPPRAEGFMDYLSFDRKQGSASIQITIKSFDSIFQRKIGLLYTDEHQKGLGFTTDKFFNTIPSIQNKEIYWGGFPVKAGTPSPPGGGPRPALP